MRADLISGVSSLGIRTCSGSSSPGRAHRGRSNNAVLFHDVGADKGHLNLGASRGGAWCTFRPPGSRPRPRKAGAAAPCRGACGAAWRAGVRGAGRGSRRAPPGLSDSGPARAARARIRRRHAGASPRPSVMGSGPVRAAAVRLCGWRNRRRGAAVGRKLPPRSLAARLAAGPPARLAAFLPLLLPFFSSLSAAARCYRVLEGGVDGLPNALRVRLGLAISFFSSTISPFCRFAVDFRRAARATSRAGGTAQATAVARGGTARMAHLHP